MTPIETIALIVIIVSAIKILTLLISPKSWLNFAKGFYKKPGVSKIVAFVLALIVLYYLVGAGITIVQILAVTAFVALLLIMGLADEVPYLIKKYEALIKKGNLWKEYWFYSLVWIILLVWGLKELFF